MVRVGGNGQGTGECGKKGNDGNFLMGCWELGGENERRRPKMGEDENPIEELLFLETLVLFRTVTLGNDVYEGRHCQEKL